MRRFLATTLALVAAVFVLSAPTAGAGGPTSVLLANYETGRSAAAINGSSAYTELQSILGDEHPPSSSSTPPGAVTTSGAGVRLVWLIHDVSPWRIDTVHVVGLVDGAVVGAVRLYPLDRHGLWKGDRLAVLPEARVRHLGAQLVRFAVATAGELGGQRMVAQVQVPNVRFFEHLGWTADGPPGAYHGVMHQPMAIPLSRGPAP